MQRVQNGREAEREQISPTGGGFSGGGSTDEGGSTTIERFPEDNEPILIDTGQDFQYEDRTEYASTSSGGGGYSGPDMGEGWGYAPGEPDQGQTYETAGLNPFNSGLTLLLVAAGIIIYLFKTGKV